jgi:2-polyprenyl-3-methyl-5-hydroxy-6-metoxy-1,4-benzoquinol methylase
MKYAPVLISVYDRVYHLEQCINSLRENPEAINTDLYVAVDFPSKEEDIPKINRVLDYLSTVGGFASVNIIKREKNYGPGKNMRAAINELYKHYDRLISMEDDNVVSKDFLAYMNGALEFYKDDDRIISISGYNYPVEMPSDYEHDVYLWSAYGGYGVGSWRHRNLLQFLSLDDFHVFLNNDDLINRFMGIAEHILPILFDGLLKSRVYGDAAISYNTFMKGKYNLFPIVSKVKNIGYDGSGENCAFDERISNQILSSEINRTNFVKDIQPDERIYKVLFNYFRIDKQRKNYTKEIVKLFREEIKERIKGVNIISPLTNSSDVTLIREVSTDFIKNQYSVYNVEIEKYFYGLKTIQLYKCNQSEFKFYYPLNLAGDGKFYEQLQKIPWYYMEDKWEFDVALNLIKENEKVLEIGSGKGAFLRKATAKSVNVYGAELNKDQAKKLKESGFKIFNENLKTLQSKYKNYFDVVCSFQVLEHVPNPREFIEENLALVKKGGRLIFSVPNHDSFVGLDELNFLDMPPHHMGLWDETSFRKIEKIFPIELKFISLEPLQSYHLDYYISILERVYHDEFEIKEDIINYVKNNPGKIKGHTILAEFIKV